MNDRFAPPVADVADPEIRRAPPPTRVVLAVRLMWASLGLGIPSLVYEVIRADNVAATVVSMSFELLMLAFFAYLNMRVYRGTNWARYVSLVLSLLGLGFLLFVPTPPENTAVETVCNWVATVLDGVALYPVFTPPGSAWFKNPGAV